MNVKGPVLSMLSDNIQTYRKKKGFSQEELAVRLHVVRQTVSKWEMARLNEELAAKNKKRNSCNACE